MKHLLQPPEEYQTCHIATPKMWRAHKGAGSHWGKSKRLNWPGMSRDAKIMLCSFHCNP